MLSGESRKLESCNVKFQSSRPLHPEKIFEFIKGKGIKAIEGLEQYSEEVFLVFSDGLVLVFYHEQDCCEDVLLEDYEASLGIDMGCPVVIDIEETTNQEEDEVYDQSQTWTFYKINTSQGDIWMRWKGESNGYYSEDVDVKLGVVTEWL